MKKIISIILVLALALCACVFSAGAVRAPHFYGDVNCDYNVDVMDATEIQRCLANISEFTLLGEMLADVDADSRVSVIDATMIQQKLAGLINDFNQDDYGIYTYIDFNNLTANFDSGKAMAGVPVTFTADAYCHNGGPLTYEYQVYSSNSNQTVFVSERSDSPMFTYTFDESGRYTITCNIYNIFGEQYMFDIEYSVSEYSDDSLMVSAVNRNNWYLNEMDPIVITADAYGGVAPYEFKFELDEPHKVQEFSQENEFEVGNLPIGEYTVKVTVRDSNGDEATASYDFIVDELRPA